MKSKILRFFLGLIILLVFAVIVLALFANPVPNHPYFADDQVLVMAHRGGRRLWPENTLYAFEHAVELGVDVLEMDVHSTSDGALVLMHDKTVDRTTDGTGPIRDFSLSEIKALDAGYNWSDDEDQTFPFRGQGITVPTLDEVFEAFPNQRMNIEIKQSDPSIVVPFCELIRGAGMTEHVLVASFDQGTIKAFRVACPGVATTAGENEVRLLYVLSYVYLGGLYQPRAEAIQVPEYRSGLHVLRPRLVEAAHDRGMEVHVWTVNDASDMERFLAMGVDGIITDRPDLMLDLLDR